jgi:hypothetical protein
MEGISSCRSGGGAGSAVLCNQRNKRAKVIEVPRYNRQNRKYRNITFFIASGKRVSVVLEGGDNGP